MNGSQVSSLEDDTEKKLPSGGDETGSREDRPAQDNVHFKVLIPSVAAGAIIGRGGEAIAQLQKESAAKVKMSKANDFYPGTTERVCLIVGTVDGIERVHDYIMDRIGDKPDANSKPIEIAHPDGSKILVERSKQVKVLVPNSTAGMIIGKGGTYIKELKDRTGSFVQISQKAKEVNLPERCITVAGEIDQNRQTVHLILLKIAEDPQSSSCPNISYSDVHGPVASAHPTGSPYASPLSPSSSSHSQQHGASSAPTSAPASAHAHAHTGGSLLAPNASALLTPPTPGTGHGPPQLGQSQPQAQPPASYQQQAPTGWTFQQTVEQPINSTGGLLTAGVAQTTVDQVASMLRQSGYTDQATEEILQAMITLANYGFLNLATLNMNVGLGRPPLSGFAPFGLQAASAGGGTLSMSMNLPSVSPTSAPLSVASPSSSFNLSASGNAFMQQSAASSSTDQHPNATGLDPSAVSVSVADRQPEESVYQSAAAGQQQQGHVSNTSPAFLMTQATGMPGQQFIGQFVVGSPAVATPGAFSPQASLAASCSPQPSVASHYSPHPQTMAYSAQQSVPASNGSQPGATALDPATMAALASQSGLLHEYAALFASSPDVNLNALSLNLNLGAMPTASSQLLSPAAALLLAAAASQSTDRQVVTAELSVPENLIGVILGVAGRQIGEIQSQTGTNIQVSKKGVFQPGSKNRLVTISGPSHNVHRAAAIIQSRVHAEESRRAREALVGGSSTTAQSGHNRHASGSSWEKASAPGTATPTPSDLLVSTAAPVADGAVQSHDADLVNQ